MKLMKQICTWVGKQQNLRENHLKWSSISTWKYTCIYMCYPNGGSSLSWTYLASLQIALKGLARSAKLFQEWLHKLSSIIVTLGLRMEHRQGQAHDIAENSTQWVAGYKKNNIDVFSSICGFFCPQSVFLSLSDVKAKLSCKMTTGKKPWEYIGFPTY